MAGPKRIESPEELERLFFEEYLTDLEKNPYKEQNWVGRDGSEVVKRIPKFPTWFGFEGYLAKIDKIQGMNDYEANRDGRYSEYTTIISRIKAYCKGECVTGSLSGVANSNLTARIHAIKEHSEVQNNHSFKILNIDPLDDSADNSTP